MLLNVTVKCLLIKVSTPQHFTSLLTPILNPSHKKSPLNTQYKPCNGMLSDVLALSSDDDGGFQSYLFSTREDFTYSRIDCKKINSSNDILLPDQIYKELGYITTKKFNFQEHDNKNNDRNYNDTINANLYNRKSNPSKVGEFVSLEMDLYEKMNNILHYNSQQISCNTGLYEEN